MRQLPGPPMCATLTTPRARAALIAEQIQRGEELAERLLRLRAEEVTDDYSRWRDYNERRPHRSLGRIPPAEFKEMLIQVHHYIKQNFEDVGTRFAEEAREIHNKKAKERPIHGTATPEEAKELSEEGVPFIALPKPQLDS